MRRGFTLVENLLALTLVSFVLILLLNLFPSSMAAVRRAEQRYRAITLADNLLEQQVATPFPRLVVGSSTETVQGDYKLRLEVLEIPGEDKAWLKNLRVTVDYAYKGSPKQIVREMRVHRLARDS